MLTSDDPALVFQGRLGILQGFVPAYREELFNLLHDRCTEGLEVFAGDPSEKGTKACTTLSRATLRLIENRSILPSPFTATQQKGVIQWLDAWQPDALICEANPRYVTTPAAVRWMQARNRPVLGWGLGTLMLAKGFTGLRTYLRRRFLTRFDGVICYSSRAEREYAAIGVARQRLFVAHNSTTRVATSQPPERAAPQSGESPVLLFVGRLNPGKKVANLISAAARLSHEPAARLVIVGGGEPDLLSALRDQAAKEFPPTEFLGPKHGDELAAWFAKADVLVLPGLGGLAVQEAMASGVPVIVADGDGTQEDLVDGATGWNVKPDDVDALVAAIADALSDRDRLRRMGTAAFVRVRDQINVDRMADKMISAVNKVRAMAGGVVGYSPSEQPNRVK